MRYGFFDSKTKETRFLCECLGEAFCKLRGVNKRTKKTHVRTTWRCKYRVLGIPSNCWKTNSVYCVYAACLHSSF